MLVMKFGGTSVAGADRIKALDSIIRDARKPASERTIVVVSAQSGVTDDLIRMSRMAARRDRGYVEVLERVRHRHEETVKLLRLGKDRNLADQLKADFSGLYDTLHGVFLVGELSDRTLDFVSAHGELLSARIIAAYLRSKGRSAGFLDAREVIRTDEQFGNARVNFTTTNRQIGQWLKKHREQVVVMTGFIASTARNETTTLGRGGSDYTAAIAGAATKAREIQIWTDVDGVLTADPRKVRKAFTVPTMSYREAMEMSHFGAKVIHPPTIQPALEKGIPLRIKNTFRPQSDGTFVSRKSNGADFLIKGISSIDDISLLTLEGSGMVGVAGISARLFSALSQSKVNVILITQGSSEHTITFAVRPGDAAQAKAAIEEAFRFEIRDHLIEQVKVEEGLSVIAVIGENMKNTPGVSARLFGALGKNGISVVATAQGSSELNISTVIRKQDLGKAMNALHQAFFLSEVKTLSVFLVGTGLIGKTLLKQVAEHRDHLKQARSLEIVIAGVANSRKMYFAPDGISLKRLSEMLDRSGEPMDIRLFVDRMKSMNLPQTVFVDCTSNESVASVYGDLIASNISVVTPNKLANAGPYRQYRKLHELVRKHHAKFLYETNVGAGLPVINTLQNLLTSGDRIRSIEAVLSGTLSYIFNTFREGIPFSEVVKQAKELGYTEPDPRIDLSGTDVARKLLILARETGLPLESGDIQIKPLLPARLMKAKTVGAFLSALPDIDAEMESLRARAAKKGCVLRFIARLENGRASIQLTEVDTKHPFYNLSGSDNIISFRTDRYNQRPLVVKGPGAGAEVTAAGVFAEIISIGNYFGVE
ncbi:MAG: bifunctional aspartate kinase/homoserine dehydrogenase I [Bacteroidota bacterium]|nr:bifunctional aspartate kinase/homoserine dehydrogenase I [Bacteroidia bacterium]